MPNPALKSFAFHDQHPRPDDFRVQVIAGLSKQKKEIPAKFFYDERGSTLFEEICALPEYYLCRAEMAIMEKHIEEFAGLLSAECALIEYGSGASRKTRMLLDHVQPQAYLPIDISCEMLKSSATELLSSYPLLNILAVCADYTRPFALPDLTHLGIGRKVVYFPGSTIGNLTFKEAHRFLTQVARLAGNRGGMLVGVDLKKSMEVLHAAYNDSQGITAAFNLNLLVRINRELGADFDVGGFEHHAFYNGKLGRVEMHLRSRRAQRIVLGDHAFQFAPGETIHTENSYKYSVKEFQDLARRAGFVHQRVWVDSENMFSVHYLHVP